jgi:hypothetical protein
MQSLILWDVPADLGADAVGYIIYEYLGYPYCNNAIDTIYDRNATSYTRSGFNPGGYTIAVYNGTTTPGNFPQHHVPPIIDKADYDSCGYTVSISWSPYVGWNEADILYNVYAMVNAQLQQLAGNITETSFVWQDAPDNMEIDLYVQAVRENSPEVKSNSPQYRVTTPTVQRPASIDLSRLTYAENEVRLDFRIDPNTALTQFEIQRAVDDAFETRHAFFDKALATYAENIDGVFRYRIVAINDCNQIARVSDTLQNFILNMTSQRDAWQLRWNQPISGEPYSFSLQRLKPNPDPALCTGITGVAFSDPVYSMLDQQSLQYCYRLEALAPRGLSVNEACAFYVPYIAMPDAIDPLSTATNAQTGRARNQFGPVLDVHPDTYAYQLRIINRNGAKIADITKNFNDNPLEKSWNGCFANGTAVPEEAYTYHLEVRFEGGRSENRTGTVMVIYKK